MSELLPEEREALEHSKLFNQDKLWEAMSKLDLNLLVTLLNDRHIRKGDRYETLRNVR